MNVKHASVFAGTVGALVLAGYANADFQQMAWQNVDNGGVVAGNTYRIYALMDNGDRLDAVAGNSAQELLLTGNGGFYQDGNGGPTSLAINSSFFEFVPSMEWDSYVTVGALYADGTPFGSNELNQVGIDWDDFEDGEDLWSDNGTWFVTPDKPQGEAINHDGLYDTNGDSIGEAYGTLIAQVTTIGDGGTFSGLLQARDGNGDSYQVFVNGFNYGAVVPAPGALALLGLAGIAGRRRRRRA